MAPIPDGGIAAMTSAADGSPDSAGGEVACGEDAREPFCEVPDCGDAEPGGLSFKRFIFEPESDPAPSDKAPLGPSESDPAPIPGARDFRFFE